MNRGEPYFVCSTYYAAAVKLLFVKPAATLLGYELKSQQEESILQLASGRDVFSNCIPAERKVTCEECKGTGSQVQQQGNDAVLCSRCLGGGKQMCKTCQGLCVTKCGVCEAKCKVKWFTQLTVCWKNNVDSRSVNNTDLSSRQVQEAQGELAFQETKPKVYPVTGFHVGAMNRFSDQLIAQHRGQFSNQCIVSQRHSISIIPVYEAICRYNDKVFNYYVYGEDKLVHAPEYPSKCCECNII